MDLSYLLKSLNETEFLIIVQELLNKDYRLNLKVYNGKFKYELDLWEGYIPNNSTKTICKILPQLPNREALNQFVDNEFPFYIDEFLPDRFFIIIKDSLPFQLKNDYYILFEKFKTKVVLLDIKDILERIDSYNEIKLLLNNFFLKNTSKFNKEKKCFLAGSNWEDNGDQAQRFYENGIWENGYNNRYIDIIKSVQVNDIIFLKSTYATAGTGYLRIKGIGIVIENKNDGKILIVNWKFKDLKIDVPGLSKYRSTFSIIANDDSEKLITFLGYTIFQLNELTPQKFEELLFKNQFVDNFKVDIQLTDIRNYILSKKEARYFWLNTEEADWMFDNTKVGSIKKYSLKNLRNKVGIKLSRVKDGDLLIGYSQHLEKLIGVFEVIESNDQNYLNIKTIYLFRKQLSWNELIKIDEFSSISIHIQNSKEFIIQLNYTVIIAIINHSELGEEVDNTDSANNSTDPPSNEPPESDSNNSDNGDDEDPIENESDKIPFHLDQVENTDRLNRESTAKSLTRLINNEIFANDGLQNGFMIHLQGEWGDGKSTFLNLIENNLNTTTDKWIVVKYNAWRNQHIDPPWWSFLNDIYRQSKNKLVNTEKATFWICENYRRIMKYQGTQKIVALIMTIFFMLVIINYRDAIFDFSENNLKTNSLNNESKGISLEIFAKLITSIGAFVGLLYSFSKFLSSPLFLRSASTAKSFMEKSTDPMKKVKEHFEGMIDDLSINEHPLAIFIDDLDRCNDEFVVGLLEGIQTLFKDRKVLFIVAGDRHWICQCFENHYSKYQGVAKQPAQKLGYLFLEKAFQLSIRLPKISKETKKEYWNYILKTDKKKDTPETKLSKEDHAKMLDEIKNVSNKNSYFDPNYVDQIQKQYNITSNEIIDAVLEEVDKNSEDIKHRLMNHHDLIDTNPRSIKRLANEYIMYRNILVSERKAFNRDKLFRWLILVNKYPQFTDWIELNPNIQIDENVLPDNLKTLIKNSDWKLLFEDENYKYGGPIEITDILIFTGLQPNIDNN